MVSETSNLSLRATLLFLLVLTVTYGTAKLEPMKFIDKIYVTYIEDNNCMAVFLLPASN